MSARRSTTVFVDRDDGSWTDVEENPSENGWYDICLKSLLDDKKFILALGLYRDGKWVDTGNNRGGINAWRLPIKIKDISKYKIHNNDGALALASDIVEGICNNYRNAYDEAINRKDYHSKEERESYMRSIEYPIRSSYFARLTMDVEDPDIIIQTLQRQVRDERRYFRRFA